MYRSYIKKCIFLTLYYESTSSSSKLSMQKYFIGIPGPILEKFYLKASSKVTP